MTYEESSMRLQYGVMLYVLLVAFLLLPMVTVAENQTITDIAGNKVEIPAQISRIVTIDPFTSQFFYVIGADDKLVGTCIGPANRNLVNVTEKSLASLPSAGCKTNVNVEQVLTLKPDLVISDKSYTKANEDMARAGIPVALVDVEVPDNLIKSYEMIGKIVGKEKEASDFISYYNEKVAQLKKNTADLTDVNKKRVYFGQREPLSTLGDDYYEAQALAIAGGQNVAEGLSGGDNKVTLDQIYTWNPEDIILLSYNSKNVTDILTDPAWKSLSAVQNKQVFRMPKYLMSWELPVPEDVLGMMWLQNTLYPEKNSFNLNAEIKEFYKKFYRLDLTDSDVDALLKDQTPTILNKPASS